MEELARVAVNWLLTVLAILASPDGPSSARRSEVDVLGPEGYRYTFTFAEVPGSGEVVELSVVPARGGRPARIGRIGPSAGNERVLDYTSEAGSGQLDLGALMDGSPRGALGDLREGSPPVDLPAGDRTVRIVRRGACIYLTDASTGETYVVRCPPGEDTSRVPAAPDPPPRRPR